MLSDLDAFIMTDILMMIFPDGLFSLASRQWLLTTWLSCLLLSGIYIGYL